MVDSIKEVDKRLSGYAHNKGADFAQVFDEWMDWTIDWFELSRVREYECNYVTLVGKMQADNEVFYDCFCIVCQDTAYHLNKQGWYDAYGSLYEMKVKSGYKASSMGQFFTPEGLCDCMAKICAEGNHGAFTYDPACGSGRLPLAMHGAIDQTKFHYFVLGDLDALSCKMSALNMMLNGMFGIVERRNALTMEFFTGYIINEMCYPFPTACPSIRRADEIECRKNLDYARSIAPRNEDGTEQKAVKIEPPATVPQTEVRQPEVRQPIQLSLFNLDEL